MAAMPRYFIASSFYTWSLQDQVHGASTLHGIRRIEDDRNAGRSVEQIDWFHAKHLPLSRELAKNLRALGRYERVDNTDSERDGL
jgi:hypothetical protein